jgi:long-chain acyl-CoA synthetase
VVVPLNVLLKPREIAYHLRDSGARAHLVFEGTPELPMDAMARDACAQAGIRQPVVLPLDPARRPRAEETNLSALMQPQPRAFDAPPRAPDDTAVILYTSGTTGQPKGAELTHANMMTNAMAVHHLIAPAFESGLAQQTTLVTLPLFHATAQTTQMNAGLFGGFRLVLLPRFEPAAVLDAFAREAVAFWVAVPTMYWALLQCARATDVNLPAATASLRLCVSGGAPMPIEVLHEFERLSGARILEGYGVSETAPVACFNQLQRPTRTGTVGLPIFGVDIRCVDEEDRPVATGARGEVVIRGANVMKGYLGRPAETALALRGGWFHTGDIGVFDEDGYLSIVDRKKDIILRGGTNVYPREVEEILLTHPAVAMCAVVGVPDDRLGEEVKAFIVRRPGLDVTEADIVAWGREQMAAYKYPRYVEFRETLPMSATGKLLKRALREAQP